MEFKYKAFISYRHAPRDSAAAKALHTAIESYIIPDKLRTDGQKRLGKVFRDEEELGVTHDLPHTICEALDETEYLIVICSPDSAQSRWVRREITHFLSNHPAEKLLTVVTGGKPDEILSVIVPECPEPLYIDLSAGDVREMQRTLKDRFLKLCAALLECDYDDLVMRDQKRKRRQLTWWIAGIAAVASVIIGILSWSNWQIDGKNEELAQKNKELEQQNNELLLRESAILTQEALEALDAGDRHSAITNAIAALPSEGNERPYYAPAEQVLFTAVDPFQDKDHNYVFQNTILEQGTAIRYFCIRSDGKRLFTADDFYTLNCFDTVSSELLWSTQITEDYLYDDPQLITCEKHNSLLYFDQDIIASVSQETGALLWGLDDLYFANDMMLYQEDADTISFILHRTDDWSAPYEYVLLTLSACDGSVVSEIPIVTGKGSFAESDLPEISFPETSAGKYQTAMFLSGGEHFMGTYYSESKNGDVLLNYYDINMTAQTCETLCSVKARSIYDPVYHFSALTHDSSLLTVRIHSEDYNTVTMEKISLSTMAPVWQLDLPDTRTQELHCKPRRSAILFSINDLLYLIDLETGTISHSCEMYDHVAALSVLKDGTFTYLLSNGMTSVGWCNSTGFHDTQFYSVELFDLGSCQYGQLWNGGSPRMEIKGEKYTGFYMTDEDSGGGYAAMVPQDNDHIVVISRPHSFSASLSRSSFPLSDSWSMPDFQHCSKDTFIFYNAEDTSQENDAKSYVAIDPGSLTKKAEYPQPDNYLPEDTLFLPDGSGYIQTGYGSLEHFDAGSAETITLFKDGQEKIDRHDQESAGIYSLAIGSTRLSDGDILSVVATVSELRLWINGSFHGNAPYPGELRPLDQWCDSILAVGANGFVLLAAETEEGSSDLFAYDVFGGVWNQLSTGFDDNLSCTLQPGSTTPVVLAIENNGTAHLFDIPTGKVLIQFQMGISRIAISKKLLCMDDSICAIVTKDNDLNLYDLSTGSMVFTERVPWSLLDGLSCFEDPENGYLFICDGDAYCEGLCLSTDTWTVVTRIPNMLLYLPDSGTILCHNESESGSGTDLTAVRLPTTEELIELGKQFLGE